MVINFHIGEVVTSLQKATLIPGGSESLVYTTLSGGIGMLVPFTSHEDQDFFQHLEMYMRSEFPPLCGRDHLSYRSYYFPVKVCYPIDAVWNFPLLSIGPVHFHFEVFWVVCVIVIQILIECSVNKQC